MAEQLHLTGNDQISYAGKWRFSVEKDFVHDTSLSLQARFLYILLQSYVSPSSAYPFPSTKTLRDLTSFSRNTLKKYLRELIDVGCLERQMLVNKRGQFRGTRFILKDKPVAQNLTTTVAQNLTTTVAQNLTTEDIPIEDKLSLSTKDEKESITIPTSKQEVIDYFLTKGYLNAVHEGEKFWEERFWERPTKNGTHRFHHWHNAAKVWNKRSIEYEAKHREQPQPRNTPTRTTPTTNGNRNNSHPEPTAPASGQPSGQPNGQQCDDAELRYINRCRRKNVEIDRSRLSAAALALLDALEMAGNAVFGH